MVQIKGVALGVQEKGVGQRVQEKRVRLGIQVEEGDWLGVQQVKGSDKG